MPTENSAQQITGVILAGGQGRRMSGKDKGLIKLGTHFLIEHAIALLKPQVKSILISANRNIEFYHQFGYPVIEDLDTGFQGPLAGILSTMKQAATDYILVIPCDAPALPEDLAVRMLKTLQSQNRLACCAFDGKRTHPVICLLHCSLLSSLEQFLAAGKRKVADWLEEIGFVTEDFSDQPESFSNINTPEDLQAALTPREHTGQ